MTLPRFSPRQVLIAVHDGPLPAIGPGTKLHVEMVIEKGTGFEYSVTFGASRTVLGESTLAALCGFDPDNDPKT